MKWAILKLIHFNFNFKFQVKWKLIHIYPRSTHSLRSSGLVFIPVRYLGACDLGRPYSGEQYISFEWMNWKEMRWWWERKKRGIFIVVWRQFMEHMLKKKFFFTCVNLYNLKQEKPEMDDFEEKKKIWVIKEKQMRKISIYILRNYFGYLCRKFTKYVWIL